MPRIPGPSDHEDLPASIGWGVEGTRAAQEAARICPDVLTGTPPKTKWEAELDRLSVHRTHCTENLVRHYEYLIREGFTRDDMFEMLPFHPSEIAAFEWAASIKMQFDRAL